MADQLFYKREQERKDRISKEFKLRKETWLIVCEGQETEPNYFNALYKFIEINYPEAANKIKFKAEGDGRNTLDLVKNVNDFFIFIDSEHRKSKIKYGKTFTVFDKDSFKPDQFDNAIYQAEVKEYIPLWSNECVELWFLLHFDLLVSNNNRKWYKSKLSDIH